MNGSPITSWEGAEAYFTFADRPDAVMFFLVLAVVVTIGVIGSMIWHEKHSFTRIKGE